MGLENGTSMVGVYWDFENIHASLFERAHGRDTWRDQRNMKAEWVVDVKAVMSFVASIGTVAINRAYNNWQYFASYRHDFHEHSIDLVQLFPRGMKNGADIRLVLDVMEDIQFFPHLSHIIVVGGDSDFISLAQKVQKTGRTIIGIGVRETTNQFWVRCCNEFKFYDMLESAPAARADDRAEVRGLLLRALRSARLARGDDLVPKATLKIVMRRLDPSFDETRFGFASFSDFVEAFPDDLEHVRNESGGLVRERVPPLNRSGSPSIEGDPAARASGADLAAFAPLTQPVRSSASPTGPRLPIPLPPPSREGVRLCRSRTGQAYELILRRGSVQPIPAPWRQRTLAHLQQIMAETPEGRFASVDHIFVNLARQLDAVGMEAERSAIDRLRGNLLGLRMLKFHGPNGVGLHPRAEEGQLARAVEEEMALRIAQQAALPVDLAGFTEVLYGSVSARALNEAESILRAIAPEAPVALELASLLEHLGDPTTDAIAEFKHPVGSPSITLELLDLPGSLKITPILLLKGGTSRVTPAPPEEFGEGDVLVVIGKSEDIAKLEDVGPA
jgi:NYN domain-containing protein/OST-HTH/LOTUS domain-containing protein